MKEEHQRSEDRMRTWSRMAELIDRGEGIGSSDGAEGGAFDEVRSALRAVEADDVGARAVAASALGLMPAPVSRPAARAANNGTVLFWRVAAATLIATPCALAYQLATRMALDLVVLF